MLKSEPQVLKPIEFAWQVLKFEPQVLKPIEYASASAQIRTTSAQYRSNTASASAQIRTASAQTDRIRLGKCSNPNRKCSNRSNTSRQVLKPIEYGSRQVLKSEPQVLKPIEYASASAQIGTASAQTDRLRLVKCSNRYAWASAQIRTASAQTDRIHLDKCPNPNRKYSNRSNTLRQVLKSQQFTASAQTDRIRVCKCSNRSNTPRQVLKSEPQVLKPIEYASASVQIRTASAQTDWIGLDKCSNPNRKCSNRSNTSRVL